MNAAQKSSQAQEISNALAEIGSLHRQTFETVSRPIAADVPLPPFPQILKIAEKNELKHTSWTDFKSRRAAKVAARRIAEQHATSLMFEARRLKSENQSELDSEWELLNENDQQTVLHVLEEAFADNEAPAAAVGVDSGTVTLVILAPDLSVIPEKYPTTTDAGNLSIKKMTKSLRNDFYKVLVCAHIVVTALEAFAVAPALTRATCVVVRRKQGILTIGSAFEPIFATHLWKESLTSAPLGSWDAAQIVDAFGQETVVKEKGVAK